MISRFFLAFILAVFPVAAFALTDEEQTAVTRAETHLESIETLQASFVQQAENGAVAHGRLLLKRPGLIRFRYAPPAQIELISDGTLVSFLDHEVGQLTQWPLFDTPLSHLVREDLNLLDETLIDDVQLSPGFIRFRLRNPDDPDQGWIRFHFADGPVRLLGWELSDAQGQQTRVSLTNPVMNAELSNNAFHFEAPQAPWATDR